MNKIFICYRREDSEGYAGWLYDRLKSHFPGRVFMDVTDIPPGADVPRLILDQIRESTAFLVVIGPRWLAPGSDEKPRLRAPRDHVRREIVEAFREGVKIIPVLVEGASMPRTEDLPRGTVPLARINALPVRHSTFDRDFQKLIEHLTSIAPAADASVADRVPEYAPTEIDPAGMPDPASFGEAAKNLGHIILFGRRRKPRPEGKPRGE